MTGMKFDPVKLKPLLLLVALSFLVTLFLHTYGAIVGLINNTSVLYRTVVGFQLVTEVIVLGEIVFVLLSYSLELRELPLVDAESLVFTEYPDVDVVLPIRYVDPEVFERTLVGFAEQSYPSEKIHIYIADDTPDEALSAQYKELADKYSATYFYRPENKKYKAGILNLLLPELKSDYLCVFDYDQIPTKHAVRALVHTIVNEGVDYVQAKKEFRGLTHYVKIWSALLYLQFFEVMQPRKEKLGVALFAGSTAIFRVSALRDIGGFPQETFTEDTDTAFTMLINGKRSKFINFLGSVGTVPENYTKQVAQVWRWSHGGSHVFHARFFPLMRSKHLNFAQKTETLSTVFITPVLLISYLYAFSFIPLLVLGIDSVRFVFFGISSLVFIPIAAVVAYVVVAVLAILHKNYHAESEFSLKQIPAFCYVGLSSNLLMLDAALLGILGLQGPNSPLGKWTRNLHIKTRSTILFILGLMILTFSLQKLLMGFTSAILVFMMGLSFLPPFIISVVQRK